MACNDLPDRQLLLLLSGPSTQVDKKYGKPLELLQTPHLGLSSAFFLMCNF